MFFLDSCNQLAVFLVLFYVKYWLCCTSAPDAPISDFDFLKLLEKAKLSIKNEQMIQFIEASYNKMKQHLWYLSERLVPLAFFSKRVDDKNKSEMSKEILRYEGVQPIGTRDMHIPQDGVKFTSMKMKQFIGSDSWTFFDLIGIVPSFLKLPVSKWHDDDSYQQIKEYVLCLNVVNDCAERALGVMTEFHMDKITTSEDQRQHLIQVVKETRSR